jgi:hypothetical protein
MKDIYYLYPYIDPKTGKSFWLERCQAHREIRYLCDTPSSDKQCSLSARVHFKGKLLCKRHAGVYALVLLLGK